VGTITSRQAARLAGGFFAVLAVVAATAHRGLLTVDRPISEWIRGEPVGGALLRAVTLLGATEVAIAIGVGLAALTWRRCRHVAIAVPLTLLAGAVLNIVLKAIVARPRPPTPDTAVSLASFPSGHTLQATLLFGLLPLLVLAWTPRRPVLRIVGALAVIGVALVGLSRVYLGAHWPSDVVGGVLFGLVLIGAAEAAVARHRHGDACSCRPALAV
jgi:undecaprenyl-diphosphatase